MTFTDAELRALKCLASMDAPTPKVAGKSPAHSSYIAYGGQCAIDFHNEFSQYGKVVG